MSRLASITTLALAVATGAAAARAEPVVEGGERVVEIVPQAAPVPHAPTEVVRPRELLQAAPHRTAEELLLVVPGVFITQHSGDGKANQIFYRGFDAVHGQDVELWAGGAPVNDVSNIHGQGYADLHFLPVEIVRAVRATPGTYDPRQGDFAVAGSLSFDLGYERPGTTAKAGVGSYGTQRVFLAHRPALAPESDFAAVELYRTSGFGPARDAARASALAQATFGLPADLRLRLFASAYGGRFSSAGVLRLDDFDAGRVGRWDSYDSTQGGSSSRAQVVASLARDDAASSAGLSAYVVLRHLRLRQNFTGYLVDPAGDSEQQRNDDLAGGAYGFYRRAVSLGSMRGSVEAGFFTRADWIDQSQDRLAVADGRVTARLVDAAARTRDLAGYLDVATRPLSWLALRAGLRADSLAFSARDEIAASNERASHGVHVGKKATIDLRLAPGVHVLAAYGEGFRSPQARSLVDGQRTPFTKVRSAELGARVTALWPVAASASVFRTTLSDDLVFDHATGRNERVPATRRLGVSADVAVNPGHSFVAAASATYTRAVFEGSDPTRQAGDLVPYAPQLVARADASFTPGLGSLRGVPVEGRLGAGASVLARRPLPYGQWGDDVFLVDVAAAARWRGLEMTLEVSNALGALWHDGEFSYASKPRPGEAASLVPARHFTAGAPRLYLLSATVTL